MALHVAQMNQQASAKASRPGKPAKRANRSSPSRSAGRRVGLLVGDHLQAVLDDAQEAIGGGELVERASASIQPPSASTVERRQRGLDAQLRMPAAGDELLGLHEELDLADAAAAELDVVPLDRDLVVPAIGMDLALHRVDVGDRGEVEILAPDERRELASNASPAATSPAQGRALIIAARSQFWPRLS